MSCEENSHVIGISRLRLFLILMFPLFLNAKRDNLEHNVVQPGLG